MDIIDRSLKHRHLDGDRGARDELRQLGHAPTANDVARHLDVSREDVNDAVMAGAGRTAESLDEPLSSDQDGNATRAGSC